jgi:hypothetical protein
MEFVPINLIIVSAKDLKFFRFFSQDSPERLKAMRRGKSPVPPKAGMREA